MGGREGGREREGGGGRRERESLRISALCLARRRSISGCRPLTVSSLISLLFSCPPHVPAVHMRVRPVVRGRSLI